MMRRNGLTFIITCSFSPPYLLLFIFREKIPFFSRPCEKKKKMVIVNGVLECHNTDKRNE
jgi:hypothetical protein